MESFLDIFPWLSDVHFEIDFITLKANLEQNWFDVSALFSTLLGGLISLLLTWWIIHAELNRQKKEQNRIDGLNAISCYFKLAGYANLIANINDMIDEHFFDSEIHGLVVTEPFQCIGPAVGTFLCPEKLVAQEYSFLLNKNDFGLIDDMLLLEQRAINLKELLENYSSMYVDFQNWIENLPGNDRELSGLLASDKIPAEYQKLWNVRAARLNQVIGGIIIQIDADLTKSVEVVQKFIVQARRNFPGCFPKMQFQFESAAAHVQLGRILNAIASYRFAQRI